jgi:hypothetical protein
VSWSPPKASLALIVAAVFANVTEFFALGATRGWDASVRMERGDARGCWEFLPICVDLSIKLFEILDNPLSCKMTRNIVGNNGEFLGVPDGIKDAMSDGSGDSSYYDGVEA